MKVHGLCLLPAWFAGARGRILRMCESEIGFYNTLGLAVLLLAGFGGVAWCLALGYVMNTSALRLWPIGLAWGLFLVTIERLLLMFPLARLGWRALVAQIVPRITLAFAVGVLLSAPLTLRIFAPEIQAQLHTSAVALARTSLRSSERFYGTRISADQHAIDRINNSETTLAQRVARYRLLAGCEAAETACSATHKLGCGPYCQYDLRLAADARAQLDSRKREDAGRLASLHASIAGLQARLEQDQQGDRSAIKNGDGLIARETALNTIERAHPAVVKDVWFLRGLFVLLDLIPITYKIGRSRLVSSPYEMHLAAERESEESEAFRRREQARVMRERIAREAEMEIEVDRVRVEAETDRRIAEIEATWSEWSTTRGPHSRRERVSAGSLASFVETMRPHEASSVEVPHRLRLGGWIGSALVACASAALGLYTFETDRMIAGEWIVLVAVTVAAGLCVYTRGFRHAPAWAMRAIFLALPTGLLLPVALLCLNL